jgi:methionyl-tRNA synthetase
MPMVGRNLVGQCPRCGAYGNSMSLCGNCSAQLAQEALGRKMASLEKLLPIRKPLLDPLKDEPFGRRKL